MSTAQTLRAKFFPPARPIVSEPRFLQKRNEPILYAILAAEQRGFERGLAEGHKVAAVEAALREPIDRPATMLSIAEDVARAHGLKSWQEMRKHRRSRDIVYPRQEAMWRCREETDQSLPAIGRFFGGFDHTTVIHACRSYEKRNGPVA